ncbi:hypothetical protein PSN_3699 [Pseudomonas sp. NGC7]
MATDVGAALCCEEAGTGSPNCGYLYRPLRSTRLLLHGW